MRVTCDAGLINELTAQRDEARAEVERLAAKVARVEGLAAYALANGSHLFNGYSPGAVPYERLRAALDGELST